jgi:predicted alpha/beta superfamily hydrolase
LIVKISNRLFIASFVIVICILRFSVCIAQQTKSDFTIGDKIYFESKILNEKEIIVVIPPYNYKKDRPDEKFPVVYVLDPGNNLFATLGIVNFYSNVSTIMPRMIVVGIVDKDRERDFLPTKTQDYPTGGGADKFLDFLDSELTHYIDSIYPTTSYRCIIGHSAGGLFAIYALENKPELFNSFIVIDPSLWYDDQSCVKKIPDFFKKNGGIKKSLFLSFSNEKDMGVFPFIDKLVKNAPEGFDWDYIHYKNETHMSLGFKSICAGFEMIFKNWKPINDSIK